MFAGFALSVSAVSAIVQDEVSRISEGLPKDDGKSSSEGTIEELYYRYKPFLQFGGSASVPQSPFAIEEDGQTSDGIKVADSPASQGSTTSSSTTTSIASISTESTVYARGHCYGPSDFAIMYAWYMPRDQEPGRGHSPKAQELQISKSSLAMEDHPMGSGHQNASSSITVDDTDHPMEGDAGGSSSKEAESEDPDIPMGEDTEDPSAGAETSNELPTENEEGSSTSTITAVPSSSAAEILGTPTQSQPRAGGRWESVVVWLSKKSIHAEYKGLAVSDPDGTYSTLSHEEEEKIRWDEGERPCIQYDTCSAPSARGGSSIGGGGGGGSASTSSPAASSVSSPPPRSSSVGPDFTKKVTFSKNTAATIVPGSGNPIAGEIMVEQPLINWERMSESAKKALEDSPMTNENYEANLEKARVV